MPHNKPGKSDKLDKFDSKTDKIYNKRLLRDIIKYFF